MHVGAHGGPPGWGGVGTRLSVLLWLFNVHDRTHLSWSGRCVVMLVVPCLTRPHAFTSYALSMHSHEYVFERLSARTELFHGLAPLKRQAEQLVHKLVECLMGSSRRRVRSELSSWVLRAGEEEGVCLWGLSPCPCTKLPL